MGSSSPGFQSLRFPLGLVGFVARPGERSCERFMRQRAFDLDVLRERIGEDCEPFAYYNLELGRAPSAKAAGKLLRKLDIDGAQQLTEHAAERLRKWFPWPGPACSRNLYREEPDGS